MGRFTYLLAAVSVLLLPGCVRTESLEQPAAFEECELDACLAYVIDQSGSFDTIWEEGGYDLFLEISEKFFAASGGEETKVVIAQLSAESSEVILFEGSPKELRRRFASPEQLKKFVETNADPTGSAVYDATRQVADYMTAMSEVSDQTRMMTVFFSDMVDSEPDRDERGTRGRQMLHALKRYREIGGAVALYFVAPSETARWRRIFDEAGFESGQFVIESRLVADPMLPTFR